MAPETFRDLLRLVHGFEASKIVLLAVENDFFTPLRQGSSAVELAAQRGLDARAVELVLNALAALGVVVKQGERFVNGPAAAQWLVAGEGYRGHIFKHIHHCWEAWDRLGEVLHNGSPQMAAEDQVLGEDIERTENFIRGMDDVTRELAPELVASLDLEDVKVVLDVGGGPARYAMSFLEQHPHLEEVRLFDLPEALEVARDNLKDFPARDRVVLQAGDLHVDTFEPGVDLVWISQVLHSLSEDECRTLLAKAARSLKPGGRVMVHEFLLDDDKAGPPQAALFAVLMLVMTSGGRGYSGAEIGAWMREAGLSDIEVRAGGPETRIVSGGKRHGGSR